MFVALGEETLELSGQFVTRGHRRALGHEVLSLGPGGIRVVLLFQAADRRRELLRRPDLLLDRGGGGVAGPNSNGPPTTSTRFGKTSPVPRATASSPATAAFG